MLVAGSMIGSGIFIVSADISRSVGSPLWLLLAWIVAGVITLLGALAYGELAAMYPRAGGQYVFLRESMGPLMGFLYGWTLFIVIQTGTIAAVACRVRAIPRSALGLRSRLKDSDGFPQMDFSTPGGPIEVGLSPQRLIALISIWLLTWINLRGIREGKLIQTTLTLIKTGALVALIVLGVTLGRNATAVAANFSNGAFSGGVTVTSAFMIAFGASLVGSLFRERCMEQRHVHCRRSKETLTQPPARPPARHRTRQFAVSTGKRGISEHAAAARGEGCRNGNRARNSVCDAGSRWKRGS
jgi:APA family basic amino acid/polyamine antiporter